MKKAKGRRVKISASKKAAVARARSMKHSEPMRPCKGRFIDYIIDMYEMPDQLELRRVYSGPSGARQDSMNIRSYFNIARSKHLTEEQ